MIVTNIALFHDDAVYWLKTNRLYHVFAGVSSQIAFECENGLAITICCKMDRWRVISAEFDGSALRRMVVSGNCYLWDWCWSNKAVVEHFIWFRAVDSAPVAECETDLWRVPWESLYHPRKLPQGCLRDDITAADSPPNVEIAVHLNTSPGL